MPRRKGCHLTWNDRLTIEKMLRQGYSKPQIARYLGVHHSTIYEECKRGAAELVDSPELSQRLPGLMGQGMTFAAARAAAAEMKPSSTTGRSILN